MWFQGFLLTQVMVTWVDSVGEKNKSVLISIFTLNPNKIVSKKFPAGGSGDQWLFESQHDKYYIE